MQNEYRQRIGRGLTASASLCILHSAFCVLLTGCQQDAQQQSAAHQHLGDRTDQAMQDPFGYRPDMSETDISGGGAGNFDKEGMKRDLNDVFNP